MIVSFCYLLLFSITLYVILVIVKLFKRSRSLIPLIPIVIIYLWSIYGAWTWIPFKLGGGRYFYEDMLFTVNIDDYYFQSLLYYSIFIIVFCTCELLNTTNYRNYSKNNYIEVIEDTLIFHGFDAIDKEMTIFRPPEISQILIMPGHIRGNGHMHHYVLSDKKLKNAALSLIFRDTLRDFPPPEDSPFPLWSLHG